MLWSGEHNKLNICVCSLADWGQRKIWYIANRNDVVYWKSGRNRDNLECIAKGLLSLSSESWRRGGSTGCRESVWEKYWLRIPHNREPSKGRDSMTKINSKSSPTRKVTKTMKTKYKTSLGRLGQEGWVSRAHVSNSGVELEFSGGSLAWLCTRPWL